MIFISAGHHASAPGAKYERFVEHDEAVIWAEKLHEETERVSTLVPTGVLKEKVAFINERLMDGDVAIEIHFNSAKNQHGEHVGRGSETLYYPGSEEGKELAGICQSILAHFFPPDRGIKEGWYRMDPSRGPNFFLAKTRCPAVILEPEFVHRFNLIREQRDNVITELARYLEIYVERRNLGDEL